MTSCRRFEHVHQTVRATSQFKVLWFFTASLLDPLPEFGPSETPLLPQLLLFRFNLGLSPVLSTFPPNNRDLPLHSQNFVVILLPSSPQGHSVNTQNLVIRVIPHYTRCPCSLDLLPKQLSTFKSLHVRVSLKGTNEEEFARLTGARPDAFKLQLKAVENLLNAGVSCHPAVMMSFTTQKQLELLKKRLFEISKNLPEQVEEEYVILYPQVEAKLSYLSFNPTSSQGPSVNAQNPIRCPCSLNLEKQI